MEEKFNVLYKKFILFPITCHSSLNPLNFPNRTFFLILHFSQWLPIQTVAQTTSFQVILEFFLSPISNLAISHGSNINLFLPPHSKLPTSPHWPPCSHYYSLTPVNFPSSCQSDFLKINQIITFFSSTPSPHPIAFQHNEKKEEKFKLFITVSKALPQLDTVQPTSLAYFLSLSQPPLSFSASLVKSVPASRPSCGCVLCLEHSFVDLCKAGSLFVTHTLCTCHCVRQVNFSQQLYLKHYHLSPRPVILCPLTLVYFSSKYLNFLYIIQ